MSERHTQANAFTLLEVLVALAIVATVMLSLVAALASGMRAERSASNAIDLARPQAVLANVLRGDIEAVAPPTGILASALLGEQSTTSGDIGPTLTFVADIGMREINYDGLDINTLGGTNVQRADATQRPVRSDLVEVEYALDVDNDSGAYQLVRRVRHNLLAQTIENGDIQQQTMIAGVRELSLRYYDGTTWLDAWDSGAENNALPQAIEMDVRRAGRPDIVLLVRPVMVVSTTSQVGVP